MGLAGRSAPPLFRLRGACPASSRMRIRWEAIVKRIPHVVKAAAYALASFTFSIMVFVFLWRTEGSPHKNPGLIWMMAAASLGFAIAGWYGAYHFRLCCSGVLSGFQKRRDLFCLPSEGREVLSAVARFVIQNASQRSRGFQRRNSLTRIFEVISCRSRLDRFLVVIDFWKLLC